MDWPERPERGALAEDDRVALAQGLRLVVRGRAGQVEQQWTLPSRSLAVAWKPGGEFVATGHRNGEVILWHAMTGVVYARTRDHNARISDLLFSPDGRMLAVASWDASISVLATE